MYLCHVINESFQIKRNLKVILMYLFYQTRINRFMKVSYKWTFDRLFYANFLHFLKRLFNLKLSYSLVICYQCSVVEYQNLSQDFLIGVKVILAQYLL